jgi:nitrogen regulatory protein PII
MDTVPLKLVTIVAEPVLEEHLTAELKRLGARGFTVTDSRGEGSRGIRASELPGAGIRIETVVSTEVADRLLAHVAKHYFPNYAVIAYVSTVEVVRGEKYV